MTPVNHNVSTLWLKGVKMIATWLKFMTQLWAPQVCSLVTLVVARPLFGFFYVSHCLWVQDVMCALVTLDSLCTGILHLWPCNPRFQYAKLFLGREKRREKHMENQKAMQVSHIPGIFRPFEFCWCEHWQSLLLQLANILLHLLAQPLIV